MRLFLAVGRNPHTKEQDLRKRSYFAKDFYFASLTMVITQDIKSHSTDHGDQEIWNELSTQWAGKGRNKVN